MTSLFSWQQGCGLEQPSAFLRVYSGQNELLETSACILDRLINMLKNEDSSIPGKVHEKISLSIINGYTSNSDTSMNLFRFQLEFLFALPLNQNVLSQFVGTQE